MHEPSVRSVLLQLGLYAAVLAHHRAGAVEAPAYELVHQVRAERHEERVGHVLGRAEALLELEELSVRRSVGGDVANVDRHVVRRARIGAPIADDSDLLSAIRANSLRDLQHHRDVLDQLVALVAVLVQVGVVLRARILRLLAVEAGGPSTPSPGAHGLDL